MKKNKGFTLIELLAVIIIIGFIAIIAIPSISRYLISSKNSAYLAFEKAMVDAAKNRIIDCETDNGDCNLPSENSEERTSLKSLIEDGYLENMKDPDSQDFCDVSSYVSIKGDKNDLESLNYSPCLFCGEYRTNSSVCRKIEGDAEDPLCGEISGDSTRWTNQNRTISVGCTDNSSGCKKPKFSKTFNKTTTNGIGRIEIVDNSERSVFCEVNAYVDKNLPTCEIKGYGEYYEHVGWYALTSTAKIENKKDEESGLLTYGMGTSIQNRDYNKKESLVIGSGITTVLGYVKDIAGNEGICGKEIRVGQKVPKFDLYYGYSIFPNAEDYSTFTMDVSGTSFTTTSPISHIRFNNLSRYKNIEKVIIKLNYPIETTTTGTATFDSTRVTGLMQQGSKEIVFVVPDDKTSFSRLTLNMGEIDGATYDINKIELLSKDGSTWISHDIQIYVEPIDQGMKTLEVSFDNGLTWSANFSKKYTDYEEVVIKTRNGLLIESPPKNIRIPIDKELPIPKVTVTKSDSGQIVNNYSWSNVGLNYSLSSETTINGSKTYYYCMDKVNTCDPNIPAEENQLITDYNTIVSNYYFRYKVVKESGSYSETKSYPTRFDITPPNCTFINPESYYGYTRPITLICTDSESSFYNDSSGSSFTYDPNYISIKSVSKKVNENEIVFTLNVEGVKLGKSTLTLRGNVISDKAGNANVETSATITVNNILGISLSKQSSVVDVGSDYIYLDSNGKLYLDIDKTKLMSPTENNISIPERPGYAFVGYFENTNGSGKKYIDENGYLVPNVSISTSKRTIFAHYVSTKKLYDVIGIEVTTDLYALATRYTGEHQDSMDPTKSNKSIYQWQITQNNSAREIDQKNNVVFAGFCWKILRTTDTGGVKLLYNGIAHYIKRNELDVYTCEDDRVTVLENKGTITVSKQDLFRIGNYFAKSYYTKRNGSTTVIYLENYKRIGMPSDANLDATIESILSTYKYMGQGSPNNLSAIFKVERLEGNNVVLTRYETGDIYNSITEAKEYSAFKNVGYMSSDKTFTSKSKNISDLTGDEIYAQGYTYSNGKYTLNNDKITIEDLSLQEEREKLNTHHYTCLSSDTECENIAYIYMANSTKIQYVFLSNGKTVSTNLNDQNNYLYDLTYGGNVHNSTIKEVIDGWYANNLLEYDSYIDDVIYCNNRSVSYFGGWDPDGGNVSKNLAFTVKNDLSLKCPREIDSFSVSNNKAKLTYKIGLATSQELYGLANRNALSNNDKIVYWLMTPDSNFFVRYANYNSISGGSPNIKNYIRPVISLKPFVEYSRGNGSKSVPYIIE